MAMNYMFLSRGNEIDVDACRRIYAQFESIGLSYQGTAHELKAKSNAEPLHEEPSARIPLEQFTKDVVLRRRSFMAFWGNRKLLLEIGFVHIERHSSFIVFGVRSSWQRFLTTIHTRRRTYLKFLVEMQECTGGMWSVFLTDADLSFVPDDISRESFISDEEALLAIDAPQRWQSTLRRQRMQSYSIHSHHVQSLLPEDPFMW